MPCGDPDVPGPPALLRALIDPSTDQSDLFRSQCLGRAAFPTGTAWSTWRRSTGGSGGGPPGPPGPPGRVPGLRFEAQPLLVGSEPCSRAFPLAYPGTSLHPRLPSSTQDCRGEGLPSVFPPRGTRGRRPAARAGVLGVGRALLAAGARGLDRSTSAAWVTTGKTAARQTPWQ